MLYHTRNFIQCFCCWNWPLYYWQNCFFYFGSSQHISNIRSQEYPKIFPFKLIILYLISFQNSNFIHLCGSKSDYILEEKACFKIGQIFRRDLRFPFHYFIFIYFRCLISNIYLLSVYNESSQGSLVSISCYFLYLL